MVEIFEILNETRGIRIVLYSVLFIWLLTVVLDFFTEMVDTIMRNHARRLKTKSKENQKSDI